MDVTNIIWHVHILLMVVCKNEKSKLDSREIFFTCQLSAIDMEASEKHCTLNTMFYRVTFQSKANC